MSSAHPRSSWGRGRGQGRDDFHGRFSLPLSSPLLPAPSVGQQQLATINKCSLRDSDSPTKLFRIQDVEYVASYNWIDKRTSTILVPGKPPKWLPPAGMQRLHEDSGRYFRDPNSAHFPRYPLEPAVRAIYELNPKFHTSTIDVFGCGNTIGSLLSFVRGEERTFRFGIERVGTTVFLIRKTNTPKEVIEDVRGFGHTFPEAYTTWEPGVRGSSSHQRIIGYDFAGLRCLVRTETDGYLPHKLSTAGSKEQRTDITTSKDRVVSASDTSLHGETSLDGAVSTLGLTRRQDEGSNTLSIVQAGTPVDQTAIFDLKTRSSKRKESVNLLEFLPRLWVNQTPNFILAWHKSGLFDDIEIKDIRSDVARWERGNQKILADLHHALEQLIQLSQAPDRSRFEVRRTGSGDLQIWSEVGGASVLPSHLMAQWRHEENEKESTDTTTMTESEEKDGDEDLKV